MARTRSPNREKAFNIYKEKQGNIKIKELANILDEKEANIRNWKSIDKWDEKLGLEKKKGGCPPENFNAVKHGGYISEQRFTKDNLGKILPKTMVNLITELQGESPQDKLWRSILMQEARIINMQRITLVKNKNDTTKELKKVVQGKNPSTEYEILFAHEKENSTVTAMSKAMETLSKMIERYEKMINHNWDLVTEEQRLKIEKLKHEVNLLHMDESEDTELNIIVDYGEDEDESS